MYHQSVCALLWVSGYVFVLMFVSVSGTQWCASFHSLLGQRELGGVGSAELDIDSDSFVCLSLYNIGSFSSACLSFDVYVAILWTCSTSSRTFISVCFGFGGGGHLFCNCVSGTECLSGQKYQGQKRLVWAAMALQCWWDARDFLWLMVSFLPRWPLCACRACSCWSSASSSISLSSGICRPPTPALGSSGTGWGMGCSGSGLLLCTTTVQWHTITCNIDFL